MTVKAQLKTRLHILKRLNNLLVSGQPDEIIAITSKKRKKSDSVNVFRGLLPTGRQFGCG